MKRNVYSASKYTQKASDAPSTVTIITAHDIKTYGYRSLADILRSVRSLHVTNDRNYNYLGIRGFGRPGEYIGRVLLLIDGYRTNENVYDNAFIDQSFLLDVDLIERVEFVPGPSSALYGNNAFFGVINVITKKGNDFDGINLTGSQGGFDTSKGRLSYGKRYDNGLDVLFSATASDRDGPDLYYPEFDSPGQNRGKAEGRDYERHHSAFGKLAFGAFTLEGGHVRREKGIPTGAYGQVFDDPNNQTTDIQDFVSLIYNQRYGRDFDLLFRLNYGRYDYSSDAAYPGIRDINRDLGWGDWWGSELRIVNTSWDRHHIVAGVEFRDNLEQAVRNHFRQGLMVHDIRAESDTYGIYLEDDIRLLDQLTLSAGARYERPAFAESQTNPRLGLIWHALDDTHLKFLYGTQFRAPSFFERNFANPAYQKVNPYLASEHIETFETSLEHFFSPRTRMTLTGFYYDIKDLITAETDPGDSRLVYRNSGALRSKGIEFEGMHYFQNGIQVQASYSWIRAQDAHGRGRVVNSPEHLAKLNLAYPLWNTGLTLGCNTQFISWRKTLAGARVDDVLLTDLTLTTPRFWRHAEFSASVYNLWDQQYGDPGATEHRQDVIRQDGRSFRVQLSLSF